VRHASQVTTRLHPCKLDCSKRSDLNRSVGAADDETVVNRRLRFVIVGLFAATVAAALGVWIVRAQSSVDEDEWVRVNEAILATIPVYPRAEPLSTMSFGEPGGGILPHENGPPYRAFWTHHTFTLPEGAETEDVRSFYEQRLTGWQRGGHDGCGVGYRRGVGALWVDACNGYMRLAVNHRAYDP
jgi:hypothetical protein